MAHKISPEAEKLIDQPIQVLDHGYVCLVDYMGNDSAIVDAARASLKPANKDDDPRYTILSKQYENLEEKQKLIDQNIQDNKLIAFLMKAGHTSPFEMVEIKLAIACPIFVMRQWIRHRTASVNEFSARYAQLPELWYMPEDDRIRYQASMNKQSSGQVASKEVIDQFKYELNLSKDTTQKHYQHALKNGIARELARIQLPVNQYTYVYWKQDLHNLLHFLDKRLRPDAQWEIQQYAKAVATICERVAPVTYNAWKKYKFEAVNFTSDEIYLINILLSHTVDNNCSSDSIQNEIVQLITYEAKNLQWQTRDIEMLKAKLGLL